MMIISFLVCSQIISEIVVMFGKLNQDSAELRESLRLMKKFMAVRKVPLTLQGKIKRYLEFQHQHQKTAGIVDRNSFFEQLSPWLRLELNEHINREVMCQYPFFANLPRRVFKRACGFA